jgi:hypothetical protein
MGVFSVGVFWAGFFGAFDRFPAVCHGTFLSLSVFYFLCFLL